MGQGTFSIWWNKTYQVAHVAALDTVGMQTVLDLRSRYGRPPKEFTSPQRYLDLGHYERVQNLETQ